MGYSAGSGSIVHQLTAFGGLQGPPPFSRAIALSPGFFPEPSNEGQERVYQDFIGALNVSSLEAARRLPTSALMAASGQLIEDAPWGTLPFGPVVDGKFTPTVPGKLLLQGSFYHDVDILTSHTANEGILFADPRVTDNTSFRAFVARQIPNILPSAVDYIANVLYPPVLNGSHAYRTHYERAALVVTEGYLAGYTNDVHRAYGNRTYGYNFALPRAIHTSDLPYIFWDGNQSSVAYPDTAVALQEYLMSFVVHGKPAAQGFPVFEEYGAGAAMARDPVANERVGWWQKAL